MRKQILSFRNALRGIANTIKSESHMRFHITAAFYVILFSFFYSFSAAQWAILILLISSVTAAEVINTCIEELCNLTADRFEPLVKAAKDAAAGAVFILAAAAAVIAVIFFWDTAVITNIFEFFTNNIIMLILLIISAVLSVLFIYPGPVVIKARLLGLKLKIKSKQ